MKYINRSKDLSKKDLEMIKIMTIPATALKYYASKLSVTAFIC